MTRRRIAGLGVARKISEEKKERRASFEYRRSSYETMLASDVCVRQWKVAVPCEFELSLLGGLLCAGLLLRSTLFRCGLLCTFFSCHLVLLLLGFLFPSSDHKILCLLVSCGLV